MIKGLARGREERDIKGVDRGRRELKPDVVAKGQITLLFLFIWFLPSVHASITPMAPKRSRQIVEDEEDELSTDYGEEFDDAHVPGELHSPIQNTATLKTLYSKLLAERVIALN